MKGWELMATSPQPIVAMTTFRGEPSLQVGDDGKTLSELPGRERLFVATTEGVFELREDGAFHELLFVKATT